MKKIKPRKPKDLTIDEQIAIFAEIIVDELLKDLKMESNKQQKDKKE
jgi:hypothetical protein